MELNNFFFFKGKKMTLLNQKRTKYKEEASVLTCKTHGKKTNASTLKKKRLTRRTKHQKTKIKANKKTQS